MAYVTVTGRLLASHFQAGGEVPLSGQIFFTPTMEKVPAGEGVHLPAPMSVELDADGRFEVELLSAGFSWEVAFSLRHAGAFVPVDCFNFLPESGVDRVNLTDIVPVVDPVTGVPMLRGEDGVGISSVSVEAGKLKVITTDGQVTLLDLPSAGFDPAVLEGYTTKAELIEALSKFTPPDVSPFTAGARYYSPVTYYWPDYYKGAESQWGKVLRFGENLGIVVMNRNSGDWVTYDQDFHTQAQLAKGAGAKRVVYYVKTQYGAAGNPDVWGAGVPDAAKYTKEHILGQLEYCATHYPDTFEGVFLDEFINGWGAQSERLTWYEELVGAIRARFGQGFLIVGNCGANCSEEVLALDVDVYMSFESTAEAYLADNPASPIHPAHMAKYPGTRFWHVVHDVTPENYQQVFAKAESMGIGHLYITDGRLVMGEGGQWQPDVNPYAVAPSQWITDLMKPWLRGVLDTRLKVEGLDARVVSLEAATPVEPVTPTLAVGEIQTLPAGSNATAEIVGDPPNFALTLGIPQGAPGAKGDKGDSIVGPAGPKGDKGDKGEPGNPSTMALVGAGRPDIPATLSTANQTAVANAAGGATFTSTDGAGAGAWAWVKTPTGWAVTYADTGWRDVTTWLVDPAGADKTALPSSPVTGGRLLARRTPAGVEMKCAGPITFTTDVAIQIPVGWWDNLATAVTIKWDATERKPLVGLPGYPRTLYHGGSGGWAARAGRYHAEGRWSMTAPWPATLPGTPAYP